MNKQGMLYTILFTFTISFVLVLILAFSNEATRERVALNLELARSRAVLTAIGISFDGDEDVLNKISGLDYDNETGLYSTEIDGKTVYAAEFSGAGVWGTIRGFAAFTADLGQFIGLEIVDHSETPGLGGRIEEPVYKDQFRGKIIPEDKNFTLNRAGNSDKDSGQIDAVTGATGTSRAMTRILNSELQRFAKKLGGNS